MSSLRSNVWKVTSYQGFKWCYQGLNWCYQGFKWCYQAVKWCYQGFKWCFQGFKWWYQGLNWCYQGFKWCYQGLNWCFQGVDSSAYFPMAPSRHPDVADRVNLVKLPFITKKVPYNTNQTSVKDILTQVDCFCLCRALHLCCSSTTLVCSTHIKHPSSYFLEDKISSQILVDFKRTFGDYVTWKRKDKLFWLIINNDYK